MPTLADLVKNINPPVEITQAEYNALPEEQRQDGTEYYITDGSSSFQIAATTPAEASDGTGSNVQVELDKRLEISKIMNGPATDSGYALDARYANTINTIESDVEEINNNMSGMKLLHGSVTNGTSWSFTAVNAMIMLFGSTSTTALNGLYGCRSGAVSKLIEATSVDVSASGTTYTITNNHVNTAVRYIIIATQS